MKEKIVALYERQWTPGGGYYWVVNYLLRTRRDDSEKWLFVSRWRRNGGYPSLGSTTLSVSKTDQNGEIIEELKMNEWDPFATLELWQTPREGHRVFVLPPCA